MKRIYPIILTILALAACSDNTPQTTDTAKAEFDKKQAEIEKSIAEQAEKDRPQFDVPAVDYTSPVAMVDLQNDKEIIAAVGLPVIEKEDGANQNGEPMTTYYFSDDLRNGLELSLSREFVDVVWKYDQDKPEKAAAVFEDGQRITRALMGGKVGGELYEKMVKGMKFEELQLDENLFVNKARCGESICRYQVLR